MPPKDNDSPGGEQVSHGLSVDKMQTPQAPDLCPPGGLERLRAAGVPLTGDQVNAIRRSQATVVDPSIPVTLAWPTALEPLTTGGVNVTGITRCSLCRRRHYVSLDANPLRRPECSNGLPPFHDGRQKPEVVRIMPVLDALPADIVFEMRAPNADLATFLRIAVEDGRSANAVRRDLHVLRRLADGRSRKRWLRPHTEAATEAIVAARVLEERICLIAEGLDLAAPSVRALVVAVFAVAEGLADLFEMVDGDALEGVLGRGADITAILPAQADRLGKRCIVRLHGAQIALVGIVLLVGTIAVALRCEIKPRAHRIVPGSRSAHTGSRIQAGQGRVPEQEHRTVEIEANAAQQANAVLGKRADVFIDGKDVRLIVEHEQTRLDHPHG